MKRPTRVTVLSVIAIIAGVFQVIGSATLFFGLGYGVYVNATDSVLLSAWALLILGMLGVVYGIGALLMKRWSWSAGVAISVLGVLLAIYVVLVFMGGTGVTVYFLFGLLIGGDPRMIFMTVVPALVLLGLAAVQVVLLFNHEVRGALGHAAG